MTEKSNSSAPFVLSGALTSVLVGCVGIYSPEENIKSVLLLLAPLVGSFIAFLTSIFLAYVGFHSTEDVKAHVKLDKSLKFVDKQLKVLNKDSVGNAAEIERLKNERMDVCLAKTKLYQLPKDSTSTEQ